MMKAFTLLVALSSFGFPVAASDCLSVITSSNDCSLDIFDGEGGNIEAICQEDRSSVELVGNITIQTEFMEQDNITALPCVVYWGNYMCLTDYAQDLGPVCEMFENALGEECGSPGVYIFKNDTTFDIPNNKAVRKALPSVTLELLIGAQEDCDEGFMSSWVTFSMVPLVGLGLFARYQRRRRPLLNLEGGTDSFVEMKDVQTHGQMA